MKTKLLFESGANKTVTNIIAQDDGRILVLGEFDKLRDQKCFKMGRLNPDGELDTSFDVKPKNAGFGLSGSFNSIALQEDAKIVFGGTFIKINDVDCFYLGRLNPDGGLDESFKPYRSIVTTGLNTQGKVSASKVQKNGLIVIGHNWDKNISWITPQGEVLNKEEFLQVEYEGALTQLLTDSMINIRVLDLQDDGKVIVGGVFREHPNVVVKQPRSSIFRLNTNGSLDTTVDFDVEMETIADLSVSADGTIMTSGTYKKIGGIRQNGSLSMVKFKMDGTVDSTFSSGVEGSVLKFIIQPDGKIMIGGIFRKIGTKQWLNIARLDPDGSVDSTFYTPGSNNDYICAMALLPDGKIIIGGTFSKIHGEKRERIARLNPDGTLDHNF
jgi:uncharacterized delta-60 repeat protein